MSAGKGTVKDYYNILGVSVTANQAEIKAAWKQRVKEWHPDVCPRADAQRLFVELSEAYHVLKDVQARRRYDFLLREHLHNPLRCPRRYDFRSGQADTGDEAKHFAGLPPDRLAELMLLTTVNLAQYLFLSWCNVVLLYPFGYLDSSENVRSS